MLLNAAANPLLKSQWTAKVPLHTDILLRDTRIWTSENVPDGPKCL
jgi:hypothetical protein